MDRHESHVWQIRTVANMKRRPYHASDVAALTIAHEFLRMALVLAKAAKAPNAARAIRHALKSTDGAVRHADLRRFHQ